MFEIIRKGDQPSLETLEAAAHGVLGGGHNISDRNEFDNRIVELGLEMYLHPINKHQSESDQLTWKMLRTYILVMGAVGATATSCGIITYIVSQLVNSSAH